MGSNLLLTSLRSRLGAKFNLRASDLVSCLPSPVSLFVSKFSCLLSIVPCRLYIFCLLSHVFCLTSPSSCLLSPISCLPSLSPISSFPSPVSCSCLPYPVFLHLYPVLRFCRFLRNHHLFGRLRTSEVPEATPALGKKGAPAPGKKRAVPGDSCSGL